MFVAIRRVSLTWSLPIATSAFGFPTSILLWGLSCIACIGEVLAAACFSSKGLRKATGTDLKRLNAGLPFYFRLAVLFMAQLVCIIVWPDGILLVTAGLPGLAAAPAQPEALASIAPAPVPPNVAGGGFAGGAPVEIVAETDAKGVDAPNLKAVDAPKVGNPEPEKDAKALVATRGDESQCLGRDLQGNPYCLDADISTLTWEPKTISVVLPCAEEREYALKTVKSVFENTPSDVLLEIVVVDDGSNPPLTTTVLKPDVMKQYKVRVMRHEQTVGLIGAKKTGGDAALGDIVVFFDCHVAPQKNWYKAFLRLIAENWRRMVVPQITALNIDSWTQVGSGGGMAKCYLTWDADFKWFDSDDMYIAVISGGLLGMSRRMWQETGGYDEQMLGWGGENLDQSLRMWLCGGEIVVATDSQVAHMWRVGNDARTGARYKHVGDTSKNRARAVYAWYGEFAKKLDHYPGFARRSHGSTPWYGDLSNILSTKERLKCRPFSWFLRRFKSIYEDAGMIPKEIFMLKDAKSNLCLKYLGSAGTAGSGTGKAKLVACEPDTDHRLFWHLGNKKSRSRGGGCCTGLRAWNTDQCLSEADGQGFSTAVCDVAGRNQQQHWYVNGDGMLQRKDTCVLTTDKGGMTRKPCLSVKSSGTKWSKSSSREPLEIELYTKARTTHPELFEVLDRQMGTITGGGAGGPPSCQQGPGGCLQLWRKSGAECLEEGMGFTADKTACLPFFLKGKALHSAFDTEMCLDRWSDEDPETWGLYSCHAGATQQFERKADGVICNPFNECFASKTI